jgi:hypothetical protein
MNKEKIEILKDLSELLDKERISIEEFETQKKQVLSSKGWPSDLLEKLIIGIKLLSPQVVVLILILIFIRPIGNLINNASEVGFGDIFAVKIEQALRISNPELASRIKELSREEIITLLNSNSSSYLVLAYISDENEELHMNARLDYYAELQRKGFIQSDYNLSEIKAILDTGIVVREYDTFDLAIPVLKRKVYDLDSFSQEEIDKIKDVSVRLSTSGTEVFSLIVNIAGDEISRLR